MLIEWATACTANYDGMKAMLHETIATAGYNVRHKQISLDPNVSPRIEFRGECFYQSILQKNEFFLSVLKDTTADVLCLSDVDFIIDPTRFYKIIEGLGDYPTFLYDYEFKFTTALVILPRSQFIYYAEIVESVLADMKRLLREEMAFADCSIIRRRLRQSKHAVIDEKTALVHHKDMKKSRDYCCFHAGHSSSAEEKILNLMLFRRRQLF